MVTYYKLDNPPELRSKSDWTDDPDASVTLGAFRARAWRGGRATGRDRGNRKNKHRAESVGQARSYDGHNDQEGGSWLLSRHPIMEFRKGEPRRADAATAKAMDGVQK
jgi:hypothetical protein